MPTAQGVSLQKKTPLQTRRRKTPRPAGPVLTASPTPRTSSRRSPPHPLRTSPTPGHRQAMQLPSRKRGAHRDPPRATVRTCILRCREHTGTPGRTADPQVRSPPASTPRLLSTTPIAADLLQAGPHDRIPFPSLQPPVEAGPAPSPQQKASISAKPRRAQPRQTHCAGPAQPPMAARSSRGISGGSGKRAERCSNRKREKSSFTHSPVIGSSSHCPVRVMPGRSSRTHAAESPGAAGAPSPSCRPKEDTPTAFIGRARA
ncbi:MAG: hypothetical protein KatS3mg132_221 [Limisphaera sp.]|nr:MAG: hypothetical protein KatS3mg132_221 [Limisphaera sp.]